MKLKVINPDGVHSREIKGLSALKDSLPNHWYGYASFEMVGANGGEIDLVICAEDRLIAVEIKDWNGKITDNGSSWQTSGRSQKSPVVSIAEKSRVLASKLKNFLGRDHHAPWVDHCVLLTGKSSRNDLSEESKAKTFDLKYFTKIGNRECYREAFTTEAWCRTPISDLKQKLDLFFSGSQVRPLHRSYNGYKAKDDPCYVHPKRIYSEYVAEKEGAKGFRALLRKWNFEELGNVDAAYLNKENFESLALREENAIGFLKSSKPEFADRNVFLNPVSNEGRDSVTLNFFELYDLPQNLSRLKEALITFGRSLKDDNRISVARLLLFHFSELHELEVTHRDIGEHCIWVSIPDKVSISGFATSSFPEQKTVSQIRETIRAGAEQLPEDLLSEPSNNYRKDVFLLGSLVHQILYGKRPQSPDNFATWEEPKDGKFRRFWSWFERALEMVPDKRFPNAMAAFEEFQRCDSLEKKVSVTIDDFQEFTKSQPIFPSDQDEIIRDDNHGLVFRKIDPEHGSCLVKVWANARFNLSDTEESARLLEFLKRIQKLTVKDLPSQQKILDFGHTRFGSYVSLKWDEGCTLDQCEFSNYDDEKAIAFVILLVSAVAEMHGAGFYHGDLKPENILIADETNEEVTIRLIDCIDYSPKGTQRRSSSYLPPEGETASTPACDGYAVGKIVTDYLFARMDEVSESFKQRVSQVLENMLDPDGGDPDLAAALRELEKVTAPNQDQQDVSQQEIVISMGGIDGDFVLLPDDRGIPVEAFPDRERDDCITICITTPDHKLLLRYDLGHNQLIKIRRIDSSLLDYTSAAKRHIAFLEHPIRILSQSQDNLHPLQLSLEDLGVFAKAAARAQGFKQQERDAIPPVSGDGKSARPEPPVEEFSDEPDDIELKDLWEALIEAESVMLPVVTVTADPVLDHLPKIVAVIRSEYGRPNEWFQGG